MMVVRCDVDDDMMRDEDEWLLNGWYDVGYWKKDI